ncbi:hypothetical protein ACLMJK_001228 [Lecanora helva]
MSRGTYIGPFGRILPIPDDYDPERNKYPDNALDETRHNNMATYQLPPPERLQFGTDLTCGVTEPMRYNTISQSNSRHGSSHRLYVEPSRQSRHDQLPSVSQLLTPSTRSSVPSPPPRSPQQIPRPPPEPAREPPREPPRTLSQSHDPSSGQAARPPQHSNRQQYPQQPPAMSQTQTASVVHPLSEEYHISPTTQNFPSQHTHNNSHFHSYKPSFDSNSQQPYPTNFEQAGLPRFPYQQHVSPTNDHTASIFNPGAAPPQHIQTLKTPAPSQYLQNQMNPYHGVPDPQMVSEQSGQARSNVVKPQPRVIAERDIPGEGPSWVYEDGSTCKKVIDGEQVNAQWGVTKAGKPRKRLAIACTTCREKKIKCDPAEPKCVQCEKFGRECRFMTAFRNQRASPRSPSYDSQARAPLVSIKAESSEDQNETSSTPRANSAERHQPPKRRNSSPETGQVKIVTKLPPIKAAPAKKQRFSLPGVLVSDIKPKAASLKSAKTAPEVPCSAWDETPCKVEMDSFSWCIDPFVVDIELSYHYLDAYLSNVNNATYRIFPNRTFRHWAQTSRRKSLQDIMTTYAILAVGSLFSFRHGCNGQGDTFCGIAKFAMEKNDGDFTLQLTHTRILLSLYYFAINAQHKAWDYSGMAIRAASGLRLNLETKCREIVKEEEFAYGLSNDALIECKRRTFWTVYLLDRFSGFCSGRSDMLRGKDIHLRLPCEEEPYEYQDGAVTAYFDNRKIGEGLPEPAGRSSLGSMALSVQITTIWSEILAHAPQKSHSSSEHYMKQFRSFYDSVSQDLLCWLNNLPTRFQFSQSNAAICMSNGDIGSFVSLHAIYHTAVVNLNRNVCSAFLTDSNLSHYMRKALNHARHLLEMMHIIEKTIYDSESLFAASGEKYHPQPTAYSTPFIGYAILSAVDVLSAGGLLKTCASTVSLMESSLVVFERLHRFWASARLQSKAIQGRVDVLSEMIGSKDATHKQAWKCTKPLDTAYKESQDLFYDDDDKTGLRFLSQLGSQITEEDVLLVD